MNTVDTFIFAPVLPWWILLPGGILFVWLLWRTYRACPVSGRQRLLLFALRIAAFLIFSWVLLLPSRREKTVEYEKPVLAVAVDVSASMTDNPGRHAVTRAGQAVQFLRETASRRRLKDFRLRFFSIGGSVREHDGNLTEKDFTDYRSFLHSGLNGIADRLRAEHVAALILLSDGLDQGDEPLSPRFSSLPVFVPLLEKGTAERVLPQDFALEKLAVPEKITRGWEAEIAVGIRRRNGSDPQQFTAVLLDGEQELRREKIVFEQNQLFQKAVFSYKSEEPGTRVLAVAINPEQDAVSENNRLDLVMEIQDGEKNILYLEGIPRWEFKFMKRSLLNEQNQKLHACLQAGNGAFISFSEGDKARTMPEFTAESLAEYRLVILGELARSAFPDGKAEILAEFVKKGGALLLLGGSRIYGADGIAGIPALRDLLPAGILPEARMHEGRFAVSFTGEALTRKGIQEMARNGAFPPVLSLWGPVKKGPFASVWLEAADGSPVLLTGRSGEGRVAMIFSDSLWRWQLGTSSAGEEKSLYAKLMTQLVEWLVPGTRTEAGEDELGIALPAGQAQLYENLAIQALPGRNVSTGGLSCRIHTPSGKELVYPVRREKIPASGREGWICRYIPDQAGTYRFEILNQEGIQSRTAVLPVKKPEFEFTGAPVNREALRNLVRLSGGVCREWPEREKIFSELPGKGRSYETIREYPVWNHWGYILALILLFSLEWLLRRKWNLA